MASSRTRSTSRAGRIASGAALALSALVALLVLVPAAIGWQWHVVEESSTTGKALALSEIVPVSELQVGDVITYHPPPGASQDTLVTHRIAWIGRDGSGSRIFRTKGDESATADPWRFRLGEPVQPRVRLAIPWPEQVVAALLGAVALVLLLLGLGRLRRQVGPHARLTT